MISIPGKYYDGKSSQAFDVLFIGNAKGHTRVEMLGNGHILVSEDLDRLKISSRLANTPRYIYFPDGGKFETQGNQAIDRFLSQFKRRSWLDAVHFLESRKRYVLIALGILILFIWGSIKYAVPEISKKIAFHLPPTVVQYAGRQTLNLLDRSILKPSQLDHTQQKKILTHFQQVIDTHADLGLKIYFRKGGPVGPNAFALPNGTIIFTDEIVQLAQHDDELLAVLVHEVGHVIHRHGMRMVIQDSLLSFVLLAMTGDVSGSSELFIGLPVLLTEMAYSRNFEREADRYALNWLQQKAISTTHFVKLMERIDKKMATLFKNSDKQWLSYLSSHPRTKDRITAFQNEKE